MIDGPRPSDLELTDAQRQARTYEARDALVRALERIDEAAEAGAMIDVVVVSFAARYPDEEGADGERLTCTRTGYETNGVPYYSAAGLLHSTLRHLEEG